MQAFTRLISLLIVSVIIIWSLHRPSPALAEPFLDVYAGGASTQKADVDSRISGFGNATLHDLKFDDSLTGGARLGLWLPQLPYFGLAVDAFYFTTNIPPQQMRANLALMESWDQGHLGVGVDLMLRAPIGTSEDFPNGRFLPYLTAGPAWFCSSWDMPGFSQARTTTLGFKGGTGAKIMLTRMVGLFGEYRLTHFKPEQDFQMGSR